MFLECLDNGKFGSNCYIVGNKISRDAVIIDAGVNIASVLAKLDTLKLSIKYIILTHNHFDHMFYVKEIKSATGAEVAIHKEDAPGFSNSTLNGSSQFAVPISFGEPDILLEDNSSLDVGNLHFEIIHTPGHSAGSISIKVNNIIFTGDTLFRTSIGRTDLPTSNEKAIIHSITKKLFAYPPDTIIYPGHGPSTSIDYEIKHNYVIKSLGG